MNNKLCVFALVLGLAALTSTRADEKRHRQLAEDYLTLSNAEKQMSLALDGQVEMMAKAYPDYYKEHKAALKRTYQRFYGWDKVKPLMSDMYMKHFTEEELTEIIKFAKSPIGQKYLKKIPELTKSSYEATMKLVGGDGAAIQKAFEEEIEKDK